VLLNKETTVMLANHKLVDKEVDLRLQIEKKETFIHQWETITNHLTEIKILARSLHQTIVHREYLRECLKTSLKI
jgi:hypothetical protein